MPELLGIPMIGCCSCLYSCTIMWAAHRFGLPDFASSHRVHLLCLDVFVCVGFICLCFHCLVSYVDACCTIETWWGEPGGIECY